MSADLIDPPAPAPSGPGLLTLLWRRRAYLVFGAVVGLGLGYLEYLRQEPVYQSRAQVYVQKRRAGPLPTAPGAAAGPSSQMAFIEDFLATHEALIRSTEVLTLAARYLERTPLEKPPPGDDYVGYIAAGLTVSREKTGTGTAANILNIGFRGPSPQDTEAVLAAVIAGYKDSLEGGVQIVTKGELDQIRLALEGLDADAVALDADAKKVRERNRPVSGPVIQDLKARINGNEMKKSDLVLREIDLKNRLKLVEEARKDGRDDRTILAALQRYTELKADRPAAAGTLEDPMVALRIQEEELLQTLGKDHPQVANVRRKIEALRNQNPGGGPAEVVEFFTRATAQEMEAIKLQTGFLDVELKKDRDTVQTLEAIAFDEAILADRRDRMNKRRTELEDRQKQIEISQEARVYDARAINPPGPGVKVAPVLVQCLLLFLALGLVGGSGLAYLAEVNDKSFRTPEEIRRRLGLAVVGHIPTLGLQKGGGPAAIGGVDRGVIAHHKPTSTEAEAYRGVRTALYFSTAGKGHQVIQVTSPNPADGKSTLAANLAVAIAQSGKRVVLVDADFRKPRIHKMFHASPEVGLASVIAGETDLARAIQPSAVPGLSLLPCGPRPANPAELLTSNRFQEVLGEIKQAFDFVLIDTPPLLAVSDPAVVAPRVDGVLLTIRITRKTRPAAERAREILATLGANVIGVVVNDMQAGKGSGGYAYQYGYGYGYGEAYGDPAEEGWASAGQGLPPFAEPVPSHKPLYPQESDGHTPPFAEAVPGPRPHEPQPV